MPQCEYHSTIDGQSVCRIVAELTDLPLRICHTNDSACEFCLQCGVAPQAPNRVTASMSVHAGILAGEALGGPITKRMSPHLARAEAPNTTCVLRGPEIRKVDCKPCQADSLVPVSVPVFRCPRHSECTLNNTGTFPKIKACSTCGERLEQYVQLDVKPAPPEVMAAIHARAANAPYLGNPHSK